jgi:hypothetical protein
MPKAEISWKRATPEGATLQCYAQHVGGSGFSTSAKNASTAGSRSKTRRGEDWLALLDSVRRRINRRLLRPEEEALLRKAISERFPGTTI